MTVNTIKPLRKLDIAYLLSKLRVHQKAHGFPYSFAVVDVVVTIQIQHKWGIGEHCRDSNQCIHGTCFLVVLIARSFLT
uniref:Uncharacterized protein n=1 Tax=Rhizophora mucronata TaxID=61149 RepID=A0A2P2P0H8_RHIMU